MGGRARFLCQVVGRVIGASEAKATWSTAKRAEFQGFLLRRILIVTGLAMGAFCRAPRVSIPIEKDWVPR